MGPILHCQNLHKSYLLGRNILPVLRGIDLSIQPGKFVIIIGSSGSGKSTLLHVLSGLDVPQRGQVLYRNEPLFEPEGLRKIPLGRDSSITDAAIASLQKAGGPIARHGIEDKLGHRWIAQRRNQLLNSAFGFVFQFYHLLPEFDVLENVLLPAMVGRPIGGWLAARTDISSRAHSLLELVGLRHRLHHRPNELSGGERQRVAICRALMNNPAVLFADEPTGNLDARTGKEIFGLLKDLNKSGQTLVMVTHDRDLAAQADQVVQLVDGKVQ